MTPTIFVLLYSMGALFTLGLYGPSTRYADMAVMLVFWPLFLGEKVAEWMD